MPTKDTIPLASLSSDTQKMVRRVRSTRRPLLITSNGKSAAVLMDANQFGRYEQQIKLLERIASGKQDIREGRTHSQKEVEALLDSWLPTDG